jgi:hypothetical protein
MNLGTYYSERPIRVVSGDDNFWRSEMFDASAAGFKGLLMPVNGSGFFKVSSGPYKVPGTLENPSGEWWYPMCHGDKSDDNRTAYEFRVSSFTAGETFFKYVGRCANHETYFPAPTISESPTASSYGEKPATTPPRTYALDPFASDTFTRSKKFTRSDQFSLTEGVTGMGGGGGSGGGEGPSGSGGAGDGELGRALKSSGEQTGLLLGVIVSGIIVAVLAIFVAVTVWFRGCFWYENNPDGDMEEEENEDSDTDHEYTDEEVVDEKGKKTTKRVRKPPIPGLGPAPKPKRKGSWVPVWERI